MSLLLRVASLGVKGLALSGMALLFTAGIASAASITVANRVDVPGVSTTWDVVYNPTFAGEGVSKIDAQLTASGYAGITGVSGTDSVTPFMQISTFGILPGKVQYGGFNFGFDSVGATTTIGTVTITYTNVGPGKIFLDVVPFSVLFQNLAGNLPPGQLPIGQLGHIRCQAKRRQHL